MKANRDYMDLALLAVDRARKSGADVAEAFVSDAESVQISVSNRQVEQMNAVREAGIGLRLLKAQKMVSGSTNELSRQAMRSLVDDLMRKVPFHTASGEFSIPAARFMIEQGKISVPVRGISIGGNLFTLLKSVDKIGADLTWFQSLGCPTFSVAAVTIGGASK